MKEVIFSGNTGNFTIIIIGLAATGWGITMDIGAPCIMGRDIGPVEGDCIIGIVGNDDGVSRPKRSADDELLLAAERSSISHEIEGFQKQGNNSEANHGLKTHQQVPGKWKNQQNHHHLHLKLRWERRPGSSRNLRNLH